MRLSDEGRRFATPAGITVLMNDLGRAMAGRERMLMLGGGNPGHIPAVEAVWRRRLQEILAEPGACERMLGNYDTPKGSPAFIESLTAFLNRRFGWQLTADNVAVMNGGQTALYCLLNLLTGSLGGVRRKVLFPLLPEYIGYADQCRDPACSVGRLPRIECIDPHTFKYRIDFDRLGVDETIGAMCVSRPTNPSGNVLSDDEVGALHAIAKQWDIPLIVDNAYGHPFPGVIFSEARPPWGSNIILTFSLSKLGLPGTRTGIVVGPPDIIEALVSMNSVLSLANGNLGQELVKPLLASDEILALCDETIRPFYARKARRALACVAAEFPSERPYAVHRCEGAFFLWLWLRELPVSAQCLYERLKARGVLVVPGPFFSFGLAEPWPHANECLRITYSQDDADVEAGIRIIADEVRRAYDVGR